MRKRGVSCEAVHPLAILHAKFAGYLETEFSLMHFLNRSTRLLAPLLLACMFSPVAADEKGDNAVANYRVWEHFGSIWLLTTPAGADLPATALIEDFPILVRLDKDFFDFSQAQPKGQDVRFA